MTYQEAMRMSGYYRQSAAELLCPTKLLDMVFFARHRKTAAVYATLAQSCATAAQAVIMKENMDRLTNMLP